MTSASLSKTDASITDTTDRFSQIRKIVASELRRRVGDIDAGAYPREILHSLGAAGAFSFHQSALQGDGKPDLWSAIMAMELVGEECLATAFCVWCQDALGWYIDNSENSELRQLLQQPVADGQRLGGTGLSNPMKAFSGIEPIRLRGRRTSGGWRVDGLLPWVSNLGVGHPFGICFESEAGHVIAVATCDGAGLRAQQSTHFIALEGTATKSVAFRDAYIPDTMVLADPAEPFVRRIRAGFILLQAGMALGLVRGCLTLMRESNVAYRDINAHLPHPAEDLEREVQELACRIEDLAQTPFETHVNYFHAVLEARLRGSELSLAASQSAMLHAGTRGYLQGSAASRKLREAYFIAVVTPAIKHLRKDMHASV